MATYRLDIEYEGTRWHGWQSQPDGHTIQDEIEASLETALREKVSIVGSGRTDAGVHARGQVAHFATDASFDLFKLLGSINGILPDSIAVRRITLVKDSFHARYDARARLYRYRICTVPLAIDRRYYWYLSPLPDIDKMNQAASLLLGKHNFSAFCRTNSETRNRVCQVNTACWSNGEIDDTWIFEISANRFLHGMVRTIVGTLIEIGRGQRAVESILAIINSQDRKKAGASAPARGLSLENVLYD